MLKRKWARTALVLEYVGVALLLVYWLLGSELFRRFFAEDIDQDGPAVAQIRRVLQLGGLALALLGIAYGCWRLRCPHCGKGSAPARWTAWDTFYCRRCGQPFVFDDEGGEASS